MKKPNRINTTTPTEIHTASVIFVLDPVLEGVGVFEMRVIGEFAVGVTYIVVIEKEGKVIAEVMTEGSGDVKDDSNDEEMIAEAMARGGVYVTDDSNVEDMEVVDVSETEMIETTVFGASGVEVGGAGAEAGASRIWMCPE